jgi:VIT1/CCC1 family predicted Fe2+/Mn2+ transporter
LVRVKEIESWGEEKRSAYLYRAVATAEAGTPRQALFKELSHEAERQAAIWARKAREAGGTVPESYQPDLRARLVADLVARLGVRPLRAVLSAMKVRGMSLYAHASHGHVTPQSVDQLEHRHQGVGGGGNLRAAVFGVNDGLISNASLIMGIAGATADSQIIVLTGVAGLVAGAFSMAAGEYVSVRSQREMYEYQIGLEREELEHYPDAEAEELALIYEARGHAREEAASMARNLIADPEKALVTLAREELGLNPEDLGSPWGAALFSFFSFAAGAAIPLAPFLVAAGVASLVAAIVASAVALFAVGATLSLFTGRSALWSGARMLAIGVAAGGLTYLVGSLLGVTLG